MGFAVWDIETGPLDADTVERRVISRTTNYTRDKQEEIERQIRQAALTPETGQVVAIGYGHSSGEKCVVGVGEGVSEADVIVDFWMRYGDACDRKEAMVGFNIFAFDLPFLVRRSWYLDLHIPYGVHRDNFQPWSQIFVDLASIWSLRKYKDFISMDLLCECMGFDGKNGHGAMFAELWATDQIKATEYLINDLRMTFQIGKRMGVL
jgi:hypothetical protein